MRRAAAKSATPIIMGRPAAFFTRTNRLAPGVCRCAYLSATGAAFAAAPRPGSHRPAPFFGWKRLRTGWHRPPLTPATSGVLLDGLLNTPLVDGDDPKWKTVSAIPR